MKVNNVSNKNTFNGLKLANWANWKLSCLCQQLEPKIQPDRVERVSNMLKNCFKDVNENIYLHAYETNRNSMIYRLSRHKSTLASFLDYIFIDFSPKKLEIKNDTFTPDETVNKIISFVENIDKNRGREKFPVAFKR